MFSRIMPVIKLDLSTGTGTTFALRLKSDVHGSVAAVMGDLHYVSFHIGHDKETPQEQLEKLDRLEHLTGWNT